MVGLLAGVLHVCGSRGEEGCVTNSSEVARVGSGMWGTYVQMLCRSQLYMWL